MIDIKLQKECYEKAIKHVASRWDLSQKYVRKLANQRGGGKDKLRRIYQYYIQNAVKNWTVEFYNKEMQKRHLQSMPNSTLAHPRITKPS